MAEGDPVTVTPVTPTLLTYLIFNSGKLIKQVLQVLHLAKWPARGSG